MRPCMETRSLQMQSRCDEDLLDSRGLTSSDCVLIRRETLGETEKTSSKAGLVLTEADIKVMQL